MPFILSSHLYYQFHFLTIHFLVLYSKACYVSQTDHPFLDFRSESLLRLIDRPFFLSSYYQIAPLVFDRPVSPTNYYRHATIKAVEDLNFVFSNCQFVFVLRGFIISICKPLSNSSMDLATHRFILYLDLDSPLFWQFVGAPRLYQI